MTKNVAVDDVTHAQIDLLARAWDVSPGEAVRRLVENFRAPSPAAAPPPSTGGRVAVHAIYDGVHIPGLYDPATQALTITEGPGAGAYRTPSGAASAVLQALKPQVKPNRNGWGFWTVDDSGELLQTLRRT
ncbi:MULTISPECIES: hypothetical protein [unclassified Streptomyces]|uniref:hypothetical protein n=1 Tax=unclassified Streptomyces TaxID=2593676 RepID=UPI001BE795A4|nr:MULTISPECIES: hypothetical protein [unclassified Streptomyces]MBT2406010.1 hypothetical protein [Streptomyces sp. ISL-21]MBT2611828.1 hypothetical protein [Streptomyces sp. ISL-87]